MSSEIRKRKIGPSEGKLDKNEKSAEKCEAKDAKHVTPDNENKKYEIKSGSYWITRVLYLRYLAFIYGSCLKFYSKILKK